MAKPIFCVTHPRACSTAFERVFMTRTDDLTCVHEPFGDAYYFGPERMGSRYEHDLDARSDSGFQQSTYKTILNRLNNDENEGKRLFIKDMSQYLVPPNGKPAQIAPSLESKRRGIGTGTSTNGSNGAVKQASPPFPYGTHPEPGNPTIVPEEILRQFHFTFLIRDPHNSIPSYYRCTIPPLDKVTGFYEFYPEEAGYDEVRRMFDYLVASGQVGPKRAGALANGVNGHQNGANGHVNGTNGHVNISNGYANGTNGYTNGTNGHSANGDGMNGHPNAEICLVDADDLLDNPARIIEEYCRSVGLDYSPKMLNWDDDAAHEKAKDAFEKWRGFHDDAIQSRDLKPRPPHKKKIKTEEEWDAEWLAKYGEKGAKLIRDTVDANMPDYLYLKQFAMKV